MRDLSWGAGVTQTLKSVSQALRILELLQRHDQLGVSEIAARLGIGSSTAHRMLATLQEAGFARQSERGRRYELGPRMEATRHASVIDRVIEAATPHMIALRHATGETVHLAALAGTDTRFLAAYESPNIMRVTSRVGTVLPAHTTAAGKVLLSHLPDDQLTSLYPPGTLTQETPESITSLDALRQELRTVRERGYGHNLAESELGVAALAVPLTDPDRQLTLALTLSGPDFRFNPERTHGLSTREEHLLALLRDAVHRIQNHIPASTEGEK
jgi:DNA-binding IclR family transcriptional regulator